MLHNDIPTLTQIEQLATAEGSWKVSIYVESGELPQQGEIARIALKDGIRAAIDQLESLGATARECAAIREHLEEVEGDTGFWTVQSRSLAVFADETRALTLRLPNHLAPTLSVGSRFHVAPLLRSVSFPQAAFVLALSSNEVHLLAISPTEEPRRVEAADLPRNFDDAVHRHFHAGQTTAGKMQGEEGQKTRLRQFARIVDRGVRSAIGNTSLPLLLAAAEPLDSIFRDVSSLPQLAPQKLPGNPDTTSDRELAESARKALDEIYAGEIADFVGEVAQRADSGRAATDLSDIAHAAAFGAIQTLVFDMDALVAGTVDASTGEVTLLEQPSVVTTNVIDDIVRLALASQSRIIAVRAAEVPGGGPAAALLRYAIT